LLAEHTIYDGFGKLISLPRNAERFKTGKWDGLKTAVLSGFDNSEQANIFVCEIVKKYPRTIRDQLSIIQKQQKKYEKNEVFHALKIALNLNFSARTASATHSNISKQCTRNPRKPK
jgi:hypothetical protein